ncbi:hypothetical protein CROQUDRAFT_657887 [Cronartium quercuum f. sp. fusiforme G11]|uniref:RNase H type-1 domain-containing protein n=1 Tax=Cronartium quercuum f. sp. fusiforme G11 TaxID=708437 RepID=A0A9P6NM81_9BASI|nr:hypothetical protein CROQUDRAFT_657887 [Cronartium quercuum f. sp. fusiforme G11]
MEYLGLALGLVQFLDQLRNEDNSKTNLAIFSDSQVALRAAHSRLQPSSGQSLIKFIKSQIRRLPENTTLYLFWTLGQEGISLNEKADIAAKQAAKAEDRKTWLPMSLTSLVQATREALSVPSSEFPSHKSEFKTPAKKIADALNGLEKGQVAAIFQLRTGHGPLNAYLHRVKQSTTKYFRGCGVPDTIAHFLPYCRKSRIQRRDFRLKVKGEELRTKLNSVNAILDDPKVFPRLAQFVLVREGLSTYVLVHRRKIKKENNPKIDYIEYL